MLHRFHCYYLGIVLQNIAIVCFPFHSLLVKTMLFTVLATLLILTIERAFTLLTMATTSRFAYCLSCLLDYCPYIIPLYASTPSLPLPLPRSHILIRYFPHYKLQTDCSLNTLLGFDSYSKPHRGI